MMLPVTDYFLFDIKPLSDDLHRQACGVSNRLILENLRRLKECDVRLVIRIPVIPGVKGPVLLIDAGANVDCQPKYLNQFGLMGSAYMAGVLGIKDPKVGLANIGTEAEKGNKLVKETYELMKSQKSYTFAGNVEARDIISGDYQVMVFDGFDGNLVLKYTEGLASALGTMLKEELMRDSRSKLGGLMAKPALKRFKARMDYHEYGGAPLLGIEGALVKAHGSSDARAIRSALHQAHNMILNDVVGKIRSGVAGLAAQAE
jgi:glycerol-3-phosphate acyltransferase PlsX